jgi:hypothetical protein
MLTTRCQWHIEYKFNIEEMPAMNGFETKSVFMQPMLLVTIQTPIEDVDRIMERVVDFTPLQIGKYDQNSYEYAPGIERYRPGEGAVVGAEPGTRKRPGVSCVSFQIPNDQELLGRIVEEVFQVHCYQEPVITAQLILASRSKGLDDGNNPDRWWNKAGDWKKAE